MSDPQAPQLPPANTPQAARPSAPALGPANTNIGALLQRHAISDLEREGIEATWSRLSQGRQNNVRYNDDLRRISDFIFKLDEDKRTDILTDIALRSQVLVSQDTRTPAETAEMRLLADVQTGTMERVRTQPRIRTTVPPVQPIPFQGGGWPGAQMPPFLPEIPSLPDFVPLPKPPRQWGNPRDLEPGQLWVRSDGGIPHESASFADNLSPPASPISTASISINRDPSA